MYHNDTKERSSKHSFQQVAEVGTMYNPYNVLMCEQRRNILTIWYRTVVNFFNNVLPGLPSSVNIGIVRVLWVPQTGMCSYSLYEFFHCFILCDRTRRSSRHKTQRACAPRAEWLCMSDGATEPSLYIQTGFCVEHWPPVL